MIDNKQNCPVCGSINIMHITLVDEIFGLYRCKNCEFVFTLPRPTLEELEEFYNTELKYNYEPMPQNEKKAKLSTKRLHNLIEKYKPDARKILDLGCSYGHTIYGLKQWGYEVVGTDLSEDACEYALKYYDIKVYNQEFPSETEYSSYDVLILSQIIEHIIDPVMYLNKAVSYLKNDGIIFIGTPNIDCILFNIFLENYEPVKPPEHISYFNHKSIKILVQRCGLTILKVYTESPIWVNYNLLNYLFFSILRRLKVLQAVRKKVNPAIKSAIASSTGITKKSKFWSGVQVIIDYLTRILSLLLYLLIKVVDEKTKDLSYLL